MKAIYCDGCGKLFKDKDINTVTVIFDKYFGSASEEHIRDFCEKCHDKLEEIILP